MFSDRHFLQMIMLGYSNRPLAVVFLFFSASTDYVIHCLDFQERL
jgi:hypothetical protein